MGKPNSTPSGPHGIGGFLKSSPSPREIMATKVKTSCWVYNLRVFWFSFLFLRAFAACGDLFNPLRAQEEGCHQRSWCWAHKVPYSLHVLDRCQVSWSTASATPLRCLVSEVVYVVFHPGLCGGFFRKMWPVPRVVTTLYLLTASGLELTWEIPWVLDMHPLSTSPVLCTPSPAMAPCPGLCKNIPRIVWVYCTTLGQVIHIFCFPSPDHLYVPGPYLYFPFITSV